MASGTVMATLLEQANSAWRQNSLDAARALMAQAFSASNAAELACHAAAFMHAMGRSQEARSTLVNLAAELPS